MSRTSCSNYESTNDLPDIHYVCVNDVSTTRIIDLKIKIYFATCTLSNQNTNGQSVIKFKNNEKKT